VQIGKICVLCGGVGGGGLLLLVVVVVVVIRTSYTYHDLSVKILYSKLSDRCVCRR
jgi:hypothetical protein